MTEPIARATEGARPLAGCLDRLATPRTGSVTTPHEHHHHPRACTSRRPLRQRRPVPAGARRDAGARRRGGDGVSRQPGWLPGGFLGVEVFFVISGYLITLLLIGEHERAGTVEPRAVLAAPLPPLAAGVVRAAGRARRLHRAVFGATRWASSGATSSPRITYVSNWYQIWVGQGYTATGRLRAAAPPVVAGGGGAVLPDLAGRDGRCCCGSGDGACPTSAGVCSSPPSPSPS